MLILQILLEEWKQLKTVYVCTKKIMGSYENIKTGKLGSQKFEDQGVSLFLLSALWLIMNMDSTGTFIRVLSLGALQPGEFRKYGTTIAPGLYAPVHQHFFVARMDMAVDCKPGEMHNQIVEVNVKVQEPGNDNVHHNAFYAEATLLRSEQEAMRDCDPLSARHWIIRNTRTVNRNGQLTGYKLVPGSNCLPLAGPEAKFLRRAAFLKHNLWVTPYARGEDFPGGEFPNQNPRAGEGLASWVKQNRSLEESDIVVWYVFGITHVPRLEDWHVMPVEHIGFVLQPHGFFNCSPAVDVPPNACEMDAKVNEVIDKGVAKSISSGLIAKL